MDFASHSKARSFWPACKYAMCQRRIAANPDEAVGYGSFAQSCFFLDRFPEAESSLQRASERKLEGPNFQMIRYNIAVLRGDQNQMHRIVALAKDKHGVEYRLAHAEALGASRVSRTRTGQDRR